MSLAALIPLLGTVFDRILPDPQAAADAKLKVMEMAQRGDLAQLDADTKLALGQIEINKAAAAAGGASWRDGVGWTCCAAFACKFIGGPLVFVVSQWLGHPITLPTFDFTEMSTILMGLLGLGSLKTVERVKGVAK